MFAKARNKLEDASILVDRLKQAEDGASFRVMFNSFLSSARAITYALQKEGKHIDGFSEWYQEKREEMTQDELLRFIHEARTEDFHEGKSRLTFVMQIGQFGYDQAGAPPDPEAQLIVSGDGPYWVIYKGTEKEKRIPIRGSGDYRLIAWIRNAPTRHLGKSLEWNDPATLCECTVDYLAKLVYEAIEKFGS